MREGVVVESEGVRSHRRGLCLQQRGIDTAERALFIAVGLGLIEVDGRETERGHR